jgi:spermidine synthase
VQGQDPTTALANRFFTIEFFRAVRKRLKGNGVFVLGALTSHCHYTNPEMLRRNRSIYYTLSLVFKNVLATPGTPLYLIADSGNQISLDEDVILARLKERDVKNANIYPFTEKFYVSKINYELRTGVDYDPLETPNVSIPIVPSILNSDSRPIANYFSIIVWTHLTNDPFTYFVQFLEKIDIYYLAIPLGIFLTVFYALLLWKRPYKRITDISLAFCIFVTGLYGMVLEIMLIFTFQSAFGYVYQYIGFLIALFMVGLTLGSILLKNTKIPFKKLLYAHILSILLLAVCFLYPPVWINFILILACGFLVGSVFSIVIAISQEGDVRRAGLIYASDIAGGLVGALVVSSLLLPLFGHSVILFILIILFSISLLLNYSWAIIPVKK